MVDFQSRYRLYAYGYTAPNIVEPVPSRQLYGRQVSRKLKQNTDVPVHDCRSDVVKQATDSGDWETKLLSQGLKQSCDHIRNLHTSKTEDTKSKPDMQLFKMGKYGVDKGEFRYPRGIITGEFTEDIIVADSKNNRVKVYNQCGVLKFMFGQKGSGPEEFDEPMDVCELPNHHLAVTDCHNKRVQVYTEGGKFKRGFPTHNKPFSIGCYGTKIIVSTIKRTIEVYDDDDKLINEFRVGKKSQVSCPLPICVNNKGEVIVCDPENSYVKFYSLNGRLISQFQPSSPDAGMAVVPSGICLNSLQQVLVADSLNHSINLYLHTGELCERLVGPKDGAGTINSLCCGPEGHIVTTECSVSGNHCIRGFRYRDCECHKPRVSSSICQTPNAFPFLLN